MSSYLTQCAVYLLANISRVDLKVHHFYDDIKLLTWTNEQLEVKMLSRLNK